MDEAIRRRHRDLIEALNRVVGADWAALYADDAVLVTPDGDLLRGRDTSRPCSACA